jgi:SAM-dependent methyltransferase
VSGRASDIQATYDRVAEEYARRIHDELRHKPLDRQLLDRFADAALGRGRVCDMGCGPGHVARYLRDRGLDVMGIDLSPGMVERARRLNEGITFEQGDMARLAVPDGAWAAMVAFYSIIHVPKGEVVPTLRELRRVLRSGGPLLLAFHVGTETLHLDEWWGHRVSADFHFHEPDEMASSLREAGFRVDEVTVREPYPDVEHQSRRAYMWATAQ